MKLATLQSLVRRGHLTPRSVVRGPTTDQMWAFVASVRGLSREFGLCYHCGEAIDPSAAQCPHCGRGQELPPDPDALMETAAPVAPPPPAPLFAPPPAPVPPADFFSSSPLVRTETGMDGGTSLDLQVDSLFPLGEPRPAATALAPAKPARPAVQRAPTPAKEEAILTARELAAAFQLDFKPPNARGNGSTRRRPVRTLAGLLLIALVAGAVVLGLRSDWRRAAFGWTLERWGMLAASLEQPAKPPSAGGTGTSPGANPTPANSPAGTPNAGGPAPGTTTPGSTPAVPQAPREPAKIAPPAVAPTPVAKAEPKPVPQPATPPTPPPVAVTPPPAPPAAVPDDLTIEQATATAVTLRLRAIDAQAKGDWPTALGCYEQIQKLPRDAWPADLTMRLEVARRHAGN